jgi:hypothetical protein
MLQYLQQLPSITPRKYRLLAVAYARYLQSLPEFEDTQPVAELGEDVAEGRATLEALWAECELRRVFGWSIANLVLARDEHICNQIRSRMGLLWPQQPPDREAACRRQFEVVRPYILCIFGNPFRPVAVDPAWLTSTVVQLAQGIYDDRAFDRLPILADALQDAGCDNDDVLNHCRGDGPHARGCWVVDLVLGKS